MSARIRDSSAKVITRWMLAAGMVVMGVLHFTQTEAFVRTVPSALPWPAMLVYISGVAEIAGGLGLLIPMTRSIAGIGLILLYLAVFPANINMALNGIFPDPANPGPSWVLWARLPFQGLLIWLAWWVSRPTKDKSRISWSGLK